MYTRIHLPRIYIEHTQDSVTNMARLVIGDNVVAYSEGSRYAERLVEDLEERLAGALRRLMIESAKYPTTAQEEHTRMREQWAEMVE